MADITHINDLEMGNFYEENHPSITKSTRIFCLYNPETKTFCLPESNGGLPVNIQDQTSEVIDLYACRVNGTTTLTANIAIDSTSLVVTSATGAVVGECINIREADRYFQSIVTNIAGTTITIGSPTDSAFTTAAQVCFGTWNHNVNGSVTEQVFFLCPPPEAVYDIYGMSISIEDNAVMYESTFGGIPALTNALVARIEDGYEKNLFLISNNAGFREYGFVTEYPDKVPAGTYAFWADKSFHIDNGVALRLNGATNDKIKIIVRDNLTALIKMAVTIHGHKVTN
jgi:hypothetical protein